MSRFHATEFHFLPVHAFRPRPGGAMTMEGGGGGGSDPWQGYAAMQQAQLSKEQLAWAKDVYAESAPDRQNTLDRANEVSDQQLAASKQQTAIAGDAYNDYKTTYQPLERGIVADATGYDTPERRAAEAQASTSDVQRNIDVQRAATAREMERSGVNPASGKMLAMQGSMDLGAAKAKAGAAFTAQKGVETVGRALKMDAANLGRNIASSQGTNAALALNAGNASVANSGMALAAQGSGNAAMQAGFNGASSAMNSVGQIGGSMAAANGAAGAADASNTAAGIGAVASVAAVVI